jgi:hypothetical protein
MTLKGQVTGDGGSVCTKTVLVGSGFGCEVSVAHGGADGEFKHRFRHLKIFPAESEVVIDGLREGIG